jgi:ribosomal protein S18 acetylase RimI-like enzyme
MGGVGLQAEVLHELSAGLVDGAADLYQHYPYKREEQRRQGLSLDRLVRQFISTLTRMVASHGTLIAVRDESSLRGLGVWVPDEWLSTHFGIRMVSLHHYLARPDDRSAKEVLAEAVVDHWKREGFDHGVVRVDEADELAQASLQGAGFTPAVRSHKLYLPLAPHVRPDSSNVLVRQIVPGEGGEVEQIAMRNHHHSRFHADPRFPDERCDTLFGTWVHRCLDDELKIVGEGRVKDQPVGLIILHIPRGLSEALGVSLGEIDFVVVDAAWQRHGVGRSLLDWGLDRMALEVRHVQLRLSADNLQAYRFYRACGFSTMSRDVVMHWWGSE